MDVGIRNGKLSLSFTPRKTLSNSKNLYRNNNDDFKQANS